MSEIEHQNHTPAAVKQWRVEAIEKLQTMPEGMERQKAAKATKAADYISGNSNKWPQIENYITEGKKSC